MTRTEALHRLAGTWNFELRDGRVRVRDVDVLHAIEAIRREGERDDARHAPVGPAARALVG